MTDEQILTLIAQGGHANHQQAFNAIYEAWAQPMPQNPKTPVYIYVRFVDLKLI